MEELRTILYKGDPLQAGLLMLGALVAGWLVHSLIFGIFLRIARRNQSQDLQLIARKLRNPSLLMLLLLSIFFFIPFLQLDPDIFRNVRHLLSLAVIFAVTWLLINGAGAVHGVLLLHFNIEQKDNLRARKVHTQLRVLERIIVAFIIVIAVATGLMTFEKIRQLGLSLLASAGIAGVVLGLAAQRTLSMMLAGIQLAFTQPIRIDDVLIVEEEWGRVEEITLTYVVINIWDERRLVVPINYFIEKPFQNWTRRTSNLIGTVFLHTDYNVPVEAMRKHLSEVLEACPLWDKRVNVLQVTDAKQNTLELRILVSASDSPTLWDLRVHVREKMILWLQENYPDTLPRQRIELTK